MRSAIALPAGSSERMRSRVALASGLATPPGTIHAGCTRSWASPSIICSPNFRSSMPSRASSGCPAITPRRLREAGSDSIPRRKSGAQSRRPRRVHRDRRIPGVLPASERRESREGRRRSCFLKSSGCCIQNRDSRHSKNRCDQGLKPIDQVRSSSYAQSSNVV